MAEKKEKEGIVRVALHKGERKCDIVKLSHLNYWVEQWVEKGYDVEIIDVVISKKKDKK